MSGRVAGHGRVAMNARLRRRVALLACAVAASCLTACGASVDAAPACTSIERLGLVAQSVPSSSYLPCITQYPAGWRSTSFDPRSGRTRFQLHSDRAKRSVLVELRPNCDISKATPIVARTAGGRTYLAVSTIDPRYSGTMYDVFPGGCVSYRFDFARGVHIELMAQLQSTTGFVTRQQLRLDLKRRLGVRLDP
jgi:hypothetical protein